jgi:hypothetical protein
MVLLNFSLHLSCSIYRAIYKWYILYVHGYINDIQLTLIVSNSVDSNFRLSQIFIEVPNFVVYKYIYNLTPVELKFRLSRIKVLVQRCRKPYYLHSLSWIYLSKHVYYLGIKIGSQVKHPVIDFDIFTLSYFTFVYFS